MARVTQVTQAIDPNRKAPTPIRIIKIGQQPVQAQDPDGPQRNVYAMHVRLGCTKGDGSQPGSCAMAWAWRAFVPSTEDPLSGPVYQTDDDPPVWIRIWGFSDPGAELVKQRGKYPEVGKLVPRAVRRAYQKRQRKATRAAAKVPP